jgi:surface polysaccharide O-acyltransferase-like enzyme
VPPTRPVKLWTMSQRAGSVSYLTFGAGFALAVLAFFVWACDVGRWRLGLFTTLGTNALAGYIIHDLVNDTIKPFTPRDAPLWYVVAAFGVSLAVCYLFIRHLEKNKLFLRL